MGLLQISLHSRLGIIEISKGEAEGRMLERGNKAKIGMMVGNREGDGR
jgi:hypothetical protein